MNYFYSANQNIVQKKLYPIVIIQTVIVKLSLQVNSYENTNNLLNLSLKTERFRFQRFK